MSRAKARTLLLVVTPPAALMGPQPVIAPLAGLSEGERIQNRFGIEDPAERIGEELAGAFSRQHALAMTVFVEADALAELPPRGPQSQPQGSPPRPRADLVLEVRTSGWTIASTLGSPPVIRYSALATLTDARSDVTLAAGKCHADQGHATKPAAPDLDTLYADGAARLKRQLNLLADHCIDKLSRELLLAPVEPRPAATASAPASRPAEAAPAPPRGPVQQKRDDE